MTDSNIQILEVYVVREYFFIKKTIFGNFDSILFSTETTKLNSYSQIGKWSVTKDFVVFEIHSLFDNFDLKLKMSSWINYELTVVTYFIEYQHTKHANETMKVEYYEGHLKNLKGCISDKI